MKKHYATVTLKNAIGILGLAEGIWFWYWWNITNEISIFYRIFYVKIFKHKKPPYFVKKSRRWNEQNS